MAKQSKKNTTKVYEKLQYIYDTVNQFEMIHLDTMLRGKKGNYDQFKVDIIALDTMLKLKIKIRSMIDSIPSEKSMIESSEDKLSQKLIMIFRFW